MDIVYNGCSYYATYFKHLSLRKLSSFNKASTHNPKRKETLRKLQPHYLSVSRFICFTSGKIIEGFACATD